MGNNDFQITYARKGVFKEIGNMPILVLFDGETITENENEITKFSFSKSDFSLKNLKANTTTYKKTQEITTTNLIKCILGLYKIKINDKYQKIDNIENCLPQNLNNIFKEIYKRLIIPLYIPLLSIIPFLLLIVSKENLNYSKFKVFTFFTGLLIIILSETTIRFVSKILFKNIGIALIPLLTLIIIYSVLIFKFKFKFRKK